jgi:hypothetical protein
MAQTGVVAGGALIDSISLRVLASAVPRDAVDDAVEATGRGAKRSGGKLPRHVMVYFAMAMALHGEDDYEEIIARLTETLRGGLGMMRGRCRRGAGSPRPGSGWDMSRCGSCSRRWRCRSPMPTPRGFLGGWRLMTIDGFEWDVPDTKENAAEFGYAGTGADPGAGRGSRRTGGDDRRVRFARGGGRGGRPGDQQGQRGAVAGPPAVPAAGRGLAADRRPELL